MPPLSQNSCVNCAKRKVKCDKLKPCSSCSRTQAACIYRTPTLSQRHRKRHTNGDLLSKIQELESLLQTHSIPFNPLCNSWINSSWEEKLIKCPQTLASSGSNNETTITAIAQSATDDQETASECMAVDERQGAAQLWSKLSEDLKNPPISQLKRPGREDVEDQSAHLDLQFNAASILTGTRPSTSVEQRELHPHPKHVFKLWQAFVDNVNPLTKIVHAPTLQEKILETAWVVESATKPLEATMFAVYALAATSMKQADCIHVFGENRQILVNRYRMGALQALSASDLISTRDLEVLQALTLVLMIDPQSELSTTAVALAMRIAHKMGLHRAAEDTHMPFFQQMSVRLWWYIRGLNSRVRRSMGLLATVDDLGDVRLPLNVNDADLHPSMTKSPAGQHVAATEMVYCLMKYDLWNFVRKSSSFSDSLNPREKATQLVASTSDESMAKKKKVLDQVSKMLQDKHLRHLDPSIPLHQLSAALAGLTIHRQRFLMFQPRHQPERGKFMSQADQDLVFESSVMLLELDYEVSHTSFSMNLMDHVACRTQVEALVYTVSELRRRTDGPLVEKAWNVLDKMNDEQPVMLQSDGVFYSALGDLTLEAWESRWRVLEQGAKPVPKFIESLQLARGKPWVVNTQGSDINGTQMGFMSDSIHEEPLDWAFWDDLLPL